MLAGALEVRAATITIDKAETQTNGGQTLTETGGDTIIVTNNGSINNQRKYEQAFGIRARDRNTITNNGSINAKDDYGMGTYGIYARDHNTITNSGSINAEEGDSDSDNYGIYARDHNTITNNGDMSTSGIRAGTYNTITNNSDLGGIKVGTNPSNISNNTISNSGKISTKGRSQSGIFAYRSRNKIHNKACGQIRTESAGAAGIVAGLSGELTNWPENGHNTIRNDGEIQTTGPGIHVFEFYKDTPVASPVTSAGIQVFGKNNTVTNTGTIRTSGEDAAGIRAVTRTRQIVHIIGGAPPLLPTDTALTNTGLISTTGANAPGI